MQKRALIPLKFEVILNNDNFQGGTKLPAWPKVSPIDGIHHIVRTLLRSGSLVIEEPTAFNNIGI